MPGWVNSIQDWLLDRRLGSRLPLPAALAVALYLGVGQADLLLRQFQQADTRAFGVAALGGGLLPRPKDAALAAELWSGRDDATRSQAWTYLLGHATFDLLLALCVAWLAWALAQRVAPSGATEEVTDWNRQPFFNSTSVGWWRRLRPLGYFVLFALLTIALRLVTFYLDGAVASYWFAYIASKAALVALAAFALALLLGLRAKLGATQTVAGEDVWVMNTGRRARLRRFRRAASVLRGQLGLVLLLSLLLLVDVTGQVADFFRRWADLKSAFLGLCCLAVLSFTLWASARRIVLADEAAAPTIITTRRLLRVGGAFAVVGAGLALWTRSPVALSLAGVFVVLLALDGFARLADWQVEDEEEAATERAGAAIAAQTPEQETTIKKLSRFVAAVPVVVVGIELFKAGVGPLILAFRPDGYTILQGAVLVFFGLVVIFVGCVVLPWFLGTKDPETAPSAGRGYALVCVGVLLVSLVLVAWPLKVPETIGSLGVVAVAFAALCLAFAELQRLSERAVPSKGLLVLGFTRTPVFLLLALWFVIASLVDKSGHHDFRTTTEGAAKEARLTDVWRDWLTQNCVAASDGPVPLVFVVAEGGGIRAAYWTGSVLTSLLEDDAPGVGGCDTATARSHIFALSGISGGSVGAAAYFSQDELSGNWYEDALGAPDYSAVALSRGLFVDLPRAVVGYGWEDRAGLLERAWEKKLPGMKQDYFTALAPGSVERDSDGDGTDDGWMPLTMFNGAQAETGCRLNTSPVPLTAPRQELDNVIDCRAVVGRYRTFTLPADDAEYQVRVPAATVTVDSVAVTNGCPTKRSFRVSTAALLSARWPYISPSGRNPCGPQWVSAIDGGYADPAGYAGFRDLWLQVAPLVAAHNAGVSGDAGLVVPVLVNVDNHYQSSARAADPRRTAELLVVPLGKLRAGGTLGAEREQAAMSLVATSPPGSALACQVPAYDPDGEPVDDESDNQPALGRVLLAPVTRPGLPAPLAWTLAKGSREDLDDQRGDLFVGEGAGLALQRLLRGEEGAVIDC